MFSEPDFTDFPVSLVYFKKTKTMRVTGVLKIMERIAWLRLFLLVGILLFSAEALFAQLKEAELNVVKEAEAMRLKTEGGIYVHYMDEPAREGGWVQYRKLMRVEPGAYDPNTGERWYNVYFSQIIPLEYQSGHDPDLIVNGWLWLPYDSPDPWKWQVVESDLVWRLGEEYPIWNPNSRPFVRRTKEGEVVEIKFFRDGLTQHFYKETGEQRMDYDWFFTLRWSQLPPSQLVPGQSFVIELSAEAGGQLQNDAVAFSARIDSKGFQVQLDPSAKSAYFPVMVGRPDSTGQLIHTDNCFITFTVPDNPPEEIFMAVILNDWGGIVTYRWEKQELY